jgi:hypothetical protein
VQRQYVPIEVRVVQRQYMPDGVDVVQQQQQSTYPLVLPTCGFQYSSNSNNIPTAVGVVQ